MSEISFPNLTDLRSLQAFRLYDTYGIGEELGFSSFEDYLASIPPIPSFPDEYAKHFDRLVLVENRLPLIRLCTACGVQYKGDDNTSVPHDPKRTKIEPLYWMMCQDGRRNHDKTPHQCRKEFQPFEIGLNVIEGLNVYAQDRRTTIVEGEHVMDLPGSVLRVARGYCAYLGVWGRGPELGWFDGSLAVSGYGSASRGE